MSSNEVAHWQPTELEQVSGVFRTSDPLEIIERAEAIAKPLRERIIRAGLFTEIGKKKHVHVEGWTMAGAMLQVFGSIEWSRRITGDDGLDEGWEARAVVRTLDGTVISAAESECMRSETRWTNRDDHALRGMAQTRALARALRQPLGFIFSLEGFEATPAEEMPPMVEQAPKPKPAAKDPTLVEERQTAEIFRLLEELDGLDPATDWAAWCREYAGVPFHKIDKIGADRVIGGLMEKVHDLSPPSEAD